MDFDLLDPKKTTIIVIDIQVDYCSPEGKLPKLLNADTKHIEDMLPRLENLLAEARKNNVKIIWTRMDETPEHMPENFRRKMEDRGKPAFALCTPGTAGFDYYKIKPEAGDKEITKTQYSAFSNPELVKYLEDSKIENIIFTGVYTSRCVDSTLRSAAERGYNCIVPEDLVGMTSLEKHVLEHNATLSVWNSIFAYVVRSDDIIKVWKDTNARKNSVKI